MDTMRHSNVAAPVQDPKLFQPVKVRVLRSFCVTGKPLAVGAEVELPYHVARDLRALGRVELI
jgi:hypothetical protein